MRNFRDEPVGITAANLVTGDRQKSYGDPLDNYERQALMISAIVRVPVSCRQAMHIMIALKMVRDLNVPFRDNEVDICGYAHLLQMEREATESEPHPNMGGPDTPHPLHGDYTSARAEVDRLNEEAMELRRSRKGHES